MNKNLFNNDYIERIKKIIFNYRNLIPDTMHSYCQDMLKFAK